MSNRIKLILLISLVFLTFFNNAIHWYTHFETYPISAFVGKNEFNIYGQEYEGRLVIALYIPYFLLLLTNIALFFFRLPKLPVWLLAVMFVFNLSIVVISLTLAVPQHAIHSAQKFITPAEMEQLLQINFLRLAAASISSGIVIWLLWQWLAKMDFDKFSLDNKASVLS